MTDFGDPALAIALDFPDRGRSVALDDQEQPAKFRIAGPVGLRQFVLAVASLRFDDGNPLLGAERLEPARKGPRHFPQAVIVQSRIVAARIAPPGAQPAAGLAQRKESVRHDTIRAVVGP